MAKEAKEWRTKPTKVFFDRDFLEGLANETSRVFKLYGTKAPDDLKFIACRWDFSEKINSESTDGRASDTVQSTELFVRRHQLDFMETLLKGLQASVSELREQYDRALEPITRKLSTGLSSIPNELHAAVFAYATSLSDNKTKQALWLSHVSRRFRTVALEERRLWTTLRSYSSAEELEAFTQRSGSTGELHVVIHDAWNNANKQARLFLEKYSSNASRWKSLTIQVQDVFPPGSVDATLLLILNHFPSILPHVEELQLEMLRGDVENGFTNWRSHNDRRFTPTSPLPALRVIRSKGHIPGPSSMYSGLTTFSVHFTLAPSDYGLSLRDLLAFLESTPTLEDLDLSIETPVEYSGGLLVNDTPCPSLSSFTLNLPSMLLRTVNVLLLGEVIEAIRMPQLQVFSLAVNLQLNDLISYAAEKHLSDFVNHLLPGSEECPELSTLNLEVTCKEDKKNIRFLHFPLPISLDLDDLPDITDLSLKVCTGLEISVPEDMDEHDNIMDSLQRVRIHDCENWYHGEFRKVVDSLKLLGSWDSVESVTIDDCPHLDYKTAIEIIGAEKLLFKDGRSSS